MINQGFGYDFSIWDKYIEEKFKTQIEKLGKYRYKNFCVFKSPQGRWMAFHNNSYTDIRVFDLETGEIVATNFYSNAVLNPDGSYNKEKSFYNGSHTNFATYVPVYTIEKEGKYKYATNLIEMSEGELNKLDLKDIISPPFAFNAYTFWAADFDFTVEMLDLREIDKGVIKRYDLRTSFTIPREANHVRDFVHVNMEYWIDMKPKEGEEGISVAIGTTSADRGDYTIDIKVLEERYKDRFNLNLNTGETRYYDMYKDMEKETREGSTHNTEDELPWMISQKRLEEVRTELKTEKSNNTND